MINLFEKYTEYDVNLDKCAPDVRETLINEFGIEEDPIITLSGEDIEKYNVTANAVDYDSAEISYDMIEEELIDKIGKFPHYLVFASNCRWNGASGYKFCGDILDTIQRPYEISLYIIKEYTNCIECKESSHDVATGSPTYICGITNEEYEKLEYADFNDIYQFVMNKLI